MPQNLYSEASLLEMVACKQLYVSINFGVKDSYQPVCLCLALGYILFMFRSRLCDHWDVIV